MAKQLQLHNAAIHALKLRDDRIRTKNFRKNLLSFIEWLARKEYKEDPDLEEWSLDDHLDAVYCIRLLRYGFRDVPDAYLIDRESMEVLIFEVEDTHPMSAQKVWRLVTLADAMNWELGLEARLFVTDRYANLTELDVKLLQPAMLQEFGAIIPLPKKGEDEGWTLTMYEGIRQVILPSYKCPCCNHMIPAELYEKHRKLCGEGSPFP